MAKQQGREMVEEARAYRERVLAELARRRDLARQQLEQLVHGRDRLLQAFERARLVAVDVVAELSPLAPPDEYVDLTPTTGPVPDDGPVAHRSARHVGRRHRGAHARADRLTIDRRRTPDGDRRRGAVRPAARGAAGRSPSSTPMPTPSGAEDPVRRSRPSELATPRSPRSSSRAGRKLKRVLADEQNEVLDALRGNEPVGTSTRWCPAAGEQAAATPTPSPSS